MKRVRAFNKASGADEGNVHASALDETTRDSFDYRCLEPACHCRFHWRRAVERRDGEFLYPTFVKNPSSQHTEGCRFDYVRIQRDIGARSYGSGDNLYLRIGFPPGGGFGNQGGWHKHHLKNLYGRHARGEKPAFSHLQDLVNHLEKNFGSLNDSALENVYLDYQGTIYNWRDLWISGQDYARLWEKAGDWDPETYGDTPSSLVAVRPRQRIDDSRRGHPRYVCAMQPAQTGHGVRDIRPVLVADKDDIQLNSLIESVITHNATMLVAARPFAPRAGANPDQGRYRGPGNVYLFTAGDRQAATIGNCYWQRVPMPRDQYKLDL